MNRRSTKIVYFSSGFIDLAFLDVLKLVLQQYYKLLRVLWTEKYARVHQSICNLRFFSIFLLSALTEEVDPFLWLSYLFGYVVYQHVSHLCLEINSYCFISAMYLSMRYQYDCKYECHVDFLLRFVEFESIKNMCSRKRRLLCWKYFSLEFERKL